ncbi:hypothetical protein T484DRAFT_1834846 [Baffinella frigidus]|nr:hypothetical protein T484DRAFT_1834846 [Cryptophyta sp. CCMP2293]
MENPCLTFVTPTLLAGDRSLSDVIAHEISHSWTGSAPPPVDPGRHLQLVDWVRARL